MSRAATDEFKVIVKSNGSLVPVLDIHEKTWRRIATIAEDGILSNIVGQRQTNGARIQTNTQATLQRKKELGRVLASLIDAEHRFVKNNQGSWKHVMLRRGGLKGIRGIKIIPATAWLRRVSKALQLKGYTGWFGLSPFHQAMVQNEFRQAIQRAIKRLAAKTAKPVSPGKLTGWGK